MKPPQRDVIFLLARILPGLKNLDVIMTPRAPRTLCKKDEKNGDDETDSAAAPVTSTSGMPKQIEGKNFKFLFIL